MKVTKIEPALHDLVTALINKANAQAKYGWRTRCMILHGAKRRAAKA